MENQKINRQLYNCLPNAGYRHNWRLNTVVMLVRNINQNLTTVIITVTMHAQLHIGDHEISANNS